MLTFKKFKANPTNFLNPSIVGNGNWEECIELSHHLLQMWQFERKDINILSVRTHKFYITHVISK